MSLSQVIQSFGALVVLAFSGWALGGSTYLGKPSASMLHKLWYLFSATLCVAGITAIIAHRLDLFDSTGRARNRAGDLVLEVFGSYIDVTAELQYVLVCLTILIIPPLMAYVLGGLYGCASTNLFTPKLVTFLIYLSAKTLISFAATGIPVIIWGVYEGWIKKSLGEEVYLISMAMAYVASGFIVIWVEMNRLEWLRTAYDRLPFKARENVLQVHKFFTRNVIP